MLAIYRYTPRINMGSFIRKIPRNLVGGRQTAMPILSSHATYYNNLWSLQIATKPEKGFKNYKTSFRELSSHRNQYQKFNEFYPDILHDIREILSNDNQDEIFARITRVLEYNLQNTEKAILHLTVLAYEMLVKKEDYNMKNKRLVYILGWCLEMLNTAGLMMDDLMDNSSHRHGQPCWYTLSNVGPSGSLNDAFILANAAYMIVIKNFRHLTCYGSLMEMFHRTALITTCGQCLDVTNSIKSVCFFNMKTYKLMAINKVTYDNFYLPFAVSAQFAGLTDKQALQQFKAVIYEIGLFAQIRNDYLDCFGSRESTGKIGTDIQDNKYSWLAVTCMEKANKEQKQIMMECYGKKNPVKVQRVKELYNILDLPKAFAAYEEESYNNCISLMKKTSISSEKFIFILNRIYHRDK